MSDISVPPIIRVDQERNSLYCGQSPCTLLSLEDIIHGPLIVGFFLFHECLIVLAVQKSRYRMHAGDILDVLRIIADICKSTLQYGDAFWRNPLGAYQDNVLAAKAGSHTA